MTDCPSICPFAGCDDCDYQVHVPGQLTLDIDGSNPDA